MIKKNNLFLKPVVIMMVMRMVIVMMVLGIKMMITVVTKMVPL